MSVNLITTKLKQLPNISRETYFKDAKKLIVDFEWFLKRPDPMTTLCFDLDTRICPQLQIAQLAILDVLSLKQFKQYVRSYLTDNLETIESIVEYAKLMKSGRMLIVCSTDNNILDTYVKELARRFKLMGFIHEEYDDSKWTSCPDME